MLGRTWVGVVALSLALAGCAGDASNDSDAEGDTTSTSEDSKTPAELCEGSVTAAVQGAINGTVTQTGYAKSMGPESTEYAAFKAAYEDQRLVDAIADPAADPMDAIEIAEDVRPAVEEVCADATGRPKWVDPKTDCGWEVVDAVADVLDAESDAAESAAFDKVLAEFGAHSQEYAAFTEVLNEDLISDELRERGTAGVVNMVARDHVDDACTNASSSTPETTSPPATATEEDPPSDTATSGTEPDETEETGEAGGADASTMVVPPFLARATEVPSEPEALPESFLDATCDAHIDYWSQVLTEDNVDQVVGMAYSAVLLRSYIPWIEDASDEPDLASDPVAVIERVCPTDNH